VGHEAVEYPTVGGVQICLPGAGALLASSLSQLEADRERHDAEGDTPPTLIAAMPTRTAERWARMRGAERCNLDALDGAMEPARAWLGEERTLLKGLSGSLAIQRSGWTGASLLPYFYLDWGGTPSFEQARTVVMEAAARTVRDFASVAVLGCGAGGLLASLAGRFDRSIGVDLSIPALLLTRRVLDGAELRLAVHPENPSLSDFPQTTVRNPRPPAGAVELVAADAGDLPFADGSLSCVVTQYLMDIVPDAGRVMGEIQRVLQPGGIWLSFGLPFRLAEDPLALRQRSEADLPALLPAFGFAPVESRLVRHDHIDLRPLSPLAVQRNHPALFFAARKVASLPAPAADAAFVAWFRGDAAAVQVLRPKLRECEALSYFLGLDARARGTAGFRVGGRRYTMLQPPSTTPSPLGALVHSYLARLDGEQTVADLSASYHLDTSGLVGEDDFVLALRLLTTLGWIVHES
jgi:SAM-dependent methyltransferase